MKISRYLITGVTMAFILVIAAAQTASAQELGGSLGSSKGVFRAKNAKSQKNLSARFAGNRASAKNSATRAARKSDAARKLRVRTNPNTNATAAEIKSNRNRPNRTPTQKSVKGVGNIAEKVELAIAEGNEARDARDFIGAQTAYLRAQELNPKDARAFYGLGNVYTDQQRWTEAETMYREALKVNPNQAEANIALSYVLLQTSRGGNLAANFEEAEEAARRAIKLEPTNPMAFDQLGVSLEQRGIIDEKTENAYRRAIELDAEFSLAYAHLGRFYRKTGKADQSEENYQKAISSSNDLITIILVAEVLQSDNRFEDSEKLLRKALEFDSDNPTVLFLLGQALVRRGNLDEAANVLNKSIRISPYSFVGHQALGAVYLRQEKFADAERIYNQALQFASEGERRQLAGTFGFAGVGDGFMKRGEPAQALRAYRQAFELDKQNSEIGAKINAAEQGGNNR